MKVARSRKRRAQRARRLRLSIYAALMVVAFWIFHQQGRESTSALYLTSDTETLARVIRSEIGVGTAKQQLHVAWVARNLAREAGQPLSEMVCHPCGPQRRGRPLSTLQDPLDSDRKLARRVLRASKDKDPTGGATHFINPLLQDRLAKSGKRSGYKGRSYKRVRRIWRRSYGWEPYYRIGPDLEMWGPKKARKGRGKARRRKGVRARRG